MKRLFCVLTAIAVCVLAPVGAADVPGQLHRIPASDQVPYEPGETVFSRVCSFHMPENALAFPRPEIEDVMASIPRERPRVYLTPNRLRRFEVKRTAVTSA